MVVGGAAKTTSQEKLSSRPSIKISPSFNRFGNTTVGSSSTHNARSSNAVKSTSESIMLKESSSNSNEIPLNIWTSSTSEKNKPKPFSSPSIIIERGREEFWTLFIIHKYISDKDEIVFTNKNWLQYIKLHSKDNIRLIKRYLNGRTEPPNLGKLIQPNLSDEDIETIDILLNPSCDISKHIEELTNALIKIHNDIQEILLGFNVVLYEYQLETYPFPREMLDELFSWMKTLPDGYPSAGNEMINDSMKTLYDLKMKNTKSAEIHYSDLVPLLKFIM